LQPSLPAGWWSVNRRSAIGPLACLLEKETAGAPFRDPRRRPASGVDCRLVDRFAGRLLGCRRVHILAGAEAAACGRGGCVADERRGTARPRSTRAELAGSQAPTARGRRDRLVPHAALPGAGRVVS